MSRESAPGVVTALLSDWQRGEASALDALLPLVYDELHAIAARSLRRERGDHTLQPTALVNEAYMRLVGQQEVAWNNRAHFLAISAQLMRRVLLDHARRRQAEKRGGEVEIVRLDTAAAGWPVRRDLDVIALDDALTRLGVIDPQQARVVELRFYAGLSVEETAEALGVSPTTVKREWRMARAWLLRELER